MRFASRIVIFPRLDLFRSYVINVKTLKTPIYVVLIMNNEHYERATSIEMDGCNTLSTQGIII